MFGTKLVLVLATCGAMAFTAPGAVAGETAPPGSGDTCNPWKSDDECAAWSAACERSGGSVEVSKPGEPLVYTCNKPVLA